MKKKLSIILLIMISLFTGYHLASAAVTPGTVKGGVGTITITGATQNATLTLYPEGNTTSTATTKADENGEATFSNIAPGNYYVEAITTTESSKSATIKVKPATVTISSTDGTDKITVSNGDPTATFTLYNSNIPGFTPKSIEADASGNGVFENLASGKGYQVRQTVNGVQSDLSTEAITIRPKQVTVVLTKQTGPSNDQGEITVTGTEVGNTLSLYRSDRSLALPPVIVTSPSGYTFSGLSAGKYFVVQTQNGVDSVDSTLIEFVDQKIPVITLKGDNPITVVYDPAQLNYTEPGATVEDNIDPVKNITSADNPIPANALPGIYTLKYNAQDSEGNKAIEVTRTVIITPNVVTLEPKNTEEAEPKGSANGEIIVSNVIPGATLYLYQDTGDDQDESNDNLIQTISQTNAKEITIDGVPVGENYYVIQEYNNIPSNPSQRTDVEDKTPPKLALNGDPSIELIVGGHYIEYGASPSDNVDAVNELNVVITGKVDTTKPGTYKLTYSVKDKSGNGPVTTERTVIVKPKAITAIGSTADIGEVGIKNALEGATLILYTSDGSEKAWHTLTAGETTYVFQNIGPGSYYATQTVSGLESARSNVVDVVDIDRPYITLNGPEKLSFVWKESKTPYYDGVANKFDDPGATAKDYLEPTLNMTTKLTKPDGSSATCTSTGECDISFTGPGIYTITYSATAPIRGSKADDKKRTITVAPPKIPGTALDSTASTSMIKIKSNVFPHSTTVVNLYNTYNQLIDSKEVPNITTATFDEVPVGLGYYITQTVNGVESAPSDPINVSLYPDADMNKFIGFSLFHFNGINAPGVIDQVNEKIVVTVPNGTDVTNLKAVFTRIQGSETVKVNGINQTSDSTTQNFTNPVKYTVVSSTDSNVKKEYTVTVQVAKSTTNIWTNTVKKSVTLKEGQEQNFALTSAEKAMAAEKGISFVADDVAIHVSPANIQESSNAILMVKDINESSFITSTDPDWKSDLTNIIEIGWGGNSEPFLQPIEVEIPDDDNQTFVRLVREDGRLYAIIQPKQDSGLHTVGLATMPGTYALLDQTVSAKITKSDSEYTLSSNWSNAAIYYTTEGKDIAFDRSARKDVIVESYLFNGTISALDNWSKYEKKAITIPNNDLYAVAMHNQIISKVSALEATPAEQWNEQIQTVGCSKVWSITFNAKIDKKALYSNVIYVIDDATNQEVTTILQLSDDGKTISIVPKVAYNSNHQYTLWLEKPIQGSSSKEFLKQPKKLTFITK